MFVPKNKYLEAATSILDDKRRARALIHALESRNEETFQFLTNDPRGLKTALLLLHNAGATSTFLVSRPKEDSQIEKIGKLIALGVESLQQMDVRLAQTILEIDETSLRKAFTYAGFTPLAILTYLEVSQLVIESKHLAENITFRSMKNTTEAELQWLLQKTYIDSLDCPQIHGMRRIQDIIAGHREQGTYDEELWTIAEFDGKLAGVLLLNRVPEMGCMELAYVGCVPEARGCGLGDALIELAMQQAADCGLPRITLAVDSENLPAFELYRRWGFRETRKRYTMIKKFY